MPYKVRCKLVSFTGDPDRFPCHFDYHIGDSFTYDGEKFEGRVCNGLLKNMASVIWDTIFFGPGKETKFLYLYSGLSARDPSMKKYDGIGFRNVLKTIVPPPYDMANLTPPNAFVWPPHGERTVAKDVTVICPDSRTSMLMKLEAFDLADKGHALPYFRRMMTILNKVMKNQGIKADKIIDEFSKEQRDGIYPALSPQLMAPLTEELDLMNYLNIEDGKASVTEKGAAKLESFKSSLSAEEREALKLD